MLQYFLCYSYFTFTLGVKRFRGYAHIYGVYRYVPPYRLWFWGSRSLNRLTLFDLVSVVYPVWSLDRMPLLYQVKFTKDVNAQLEKKKIILLIIIFTLEYYLEKWFRETCVFLLSPQLHFSGFRFDPRDGTNSNVTVLANLGKNIRFNEGCFRHWELCTGKLLFGGHSRKAVRWFPVHKCVITNCQRSFARST